MFLTAFSMTMGVLAALIATFYLTLSVVEFMEKRR